MFTMKKILEISKAITRGEDITKKEYYKEYLESLIRDNIYNFKEVIPDVSDTNSTILWNETCKSENKFDNFLINIDGTNKKVSEIIKSIILSDDETPKVVTYISERTGKKVEDISNIFIEFFKQFKSIIEMKGVDKYLKESDISKEFIDLLDKKINLVINIDTNIPASNTDIVFDKDDEELSKGSENNEETGGMIHPFEFLKGNKNLDNEKNKKGDDVTINPFENAKIINDGLWNQSFINSSMPAYIPYGTNIIMLKIHAILNLLRIKGIFIRGQFMSNPGDYTVNLSSMKIYNQFGDTILYTENDRLVFSTADGIITEFSLGNGNTKIA